jgi:hypothetical protein
VDLIECLSKQSLSVINSILSYFVITVIGPFSQRQARLISSGKCLDFYGLKLPVSVCLSKVLAILPLSKWRLGTWRNGHFRILFWDIFSQYIIVVFYKLNTIILIYSVIPNSLNIFLLRQNEKSKCVELAYWLHQLRAAISIKELMMFYTYSKAANMRNS